MFDSTTDTFEFLDPENSADAELLRQRCIEDAEIWELKRRAALPYREPDRLPAVARAS